MRNRIKFKIRSDQVWRDKRVDLAAGPKNVFEQETIYQKNHQAKYAVGMN